MDCSEAAGDKECTAGSAVAAAEAAGEADHGAEATEGSAKDRELADSSTQATGCGAKEDGQATPPNHGAGSTEHAPMDDGDDGAVAAPSHAQELEIDKWVVVAESKITDVQMEPESNTAGESAAVVSLVSASDMGIPLQDRSVRRRLTGPPDLAHSECSASPDESLDCGKRSLPPNPPASPLLKRAVRCGCLMLTNVGNNLGDWTPTANSCTATCSTEGASFFLEHGAGYQWP